MLYEGERLVNEDYRKKKTERYSEIIRGMKFSFLYYRYPCFFRLTIRMEMAAGVMPDILEAWPRK
jgi:hypothetical protein